MSDNGPERWTVLVNAEEQYGLFPAELPLPDGWRPADFTGTEDECVRYVDEHWTDMRPLSLRKALGGSAA
ncbi:antibiotic synthesis protein MbtH [Streptomyces populi]|uniref:Antibiotic synthesis protein MbtH n=1 Tax=Streptomyces populi TaxID=2058924 RepID=A0A2I0SX52_9ACTN|nr:MbtH family NRPS accessory protein [Streptomyces populi]PKT74470.1 antibiotic synthesis protein MbtH [Streptomyces populi]